MAGKRQRARKTKQRQHHASQPPPPPPPHKPPTAPPPSGGGGPNSRGYNFDQVTIDYGKWTDSRHRVHDDPPDSLSQLRRVDLLAVKITYPDGEEIWRSFVGTFDDWDELMDHVEGWFYDPSGTP